MKIEFDKILRALHDGKVEFIVVGGMAMVSHGSAYVTRDVDICYKRSPENLNAMELRELKKRLEGN